MNLAPIILFVYNRPWHTSQTLEALMHNELADQAELYIFADGPTADASEESLKNIKETREVLNEKSWCGTVHITIRATNMGLANSVVDGITQVINKHGKVIVLEDDIVTNTHFLSFMNDGLDLYKNEKKVFGVSGFCFPSSEKIKIDTYFLPIMSSWGYGIWADRWKMINFDGENLLKKVELEKVESDLNFGNINYFQMLKDQVAGRNDSWAVRFYVSMFFQKGLFLYPNISLLRNIGFDGTGVHCDADVTTIYNKNFDINCEIQVVEQKVKVLKNIEAAFKDSDLKTQKSIKKDVTDKFLKLFHPKIKKYVKRVLRRGEIESNQNVYLHLENFPRYTQTNGVLKGKQITIPDAASFLFMYKEIFEQEIYKFNTTNVEPYIIDAGANIGLSSIYFKMLFPDAHIVAFEPDETIFEILQLNLESFGFNDVELHKKGLWDSDTKLSFKSEGADAGIISDLHDLNSATSKVDVTSLNPFLTKKVDLLKIDIEGAETIVLKNIENNLDVVERIFVEYHSFAGQKQSLNQVIDILSKANFRLYMSMPGNNSGSPFMGLTEYYNMDFQVNIFGFKENLI
jgi:FkbM family methyltransferase